MKKNPRIFLEHILESILEIKNYTTGLTKSQFSHDKKTQDAVIRRLEIIGEAARRLSDETRQNLPVIPFNTMADMRNLLIHEYDDVDLSIVWDTIQNDLPPLITTLEKIVPPDETT